MLRTVSKLSTPLLAQGFGVVALVSLIVLTQVQNGLTLELQFIESQTNTWIEGKVNISLQNVYGFNIPQLHTNDSYIRVEFNAALNSNERCPVYFIIRQRNEVQTIALPQSHEATNLPIYNGARNLCLGPEEWSSSVFITVSTCNLDNVRYSFNLSMRKGYIIKLNDEPKVAHNVSSTAPIFYRFGFPQNVSFVKIIANSTTASKTVISIQKPGCPVNDELSNIQYSGHWHTMSQRTALIVRKETYPEGFILLFLPDPRLNSHVSRNAASKSETISFQILGPPDEDQVVIPSFWIPILIHFLVILLVHLMFSCCHHQYVGAHNPEFTPAFINRLCPVNYCETRLRVESFTAETKLYKYLKANSYRYIWTILTIVFFYGLPVILLSLTLTNFAKTGDLDICHFNYFCSYPVWIFVSFNHVYSCIGFVIAGITFMVLVHVRATKLVVSEVHGGAMFGENLDANPWRWCRFRRVNLTGTVYGAYQNFGTFYTLGFALMFVGIMKMAYNTCPSKDTTFFGLTFMFIIVVLCQIKIYNLRHPCMVTDNFTFLSTGLVIGVITAAYLITDRTFQIVVSVFLSFWIQLTVLILHSAGYLEEDVHPTPNTTAETEMEDPTPKRRARSVSACQPTANNTKLVNAPTALFRSVLCSWNFLPLFYPEWKRRTFWTVLRFLLNVGILTFIWLGMTENHFTTRMYILVLANFHLDFISYFIIHKGCHHEFSKFTSWQPLIYLILAVLFWVLSLTALVTSLDAWELPAIFLQEKFTPCIVGIYDALDMYHWLAAPAWFFTFMVMLTADDQLSRNRTEMTVVF